MVDEIKDELANAWQVDSPFPKATGEDKTAKLTAWKSCLDDRKVPKGDAVEEASSCLSRVTRKVFGASDKITFKQFVFVVLVFRSWRKGCSMAQPDGTSAFSSFKTLYNKLRPKETSVMALMRQHE